MYIGYVFAIDFAKQFQITHKKSGVFLHVFNLCKVFPEYFLASLVI